MTKEVTPEQTLTALRSSTKSVILSTVGADGSPHSGYTPFAFEGNNIIIFVSRLSLHTRDLLACEKVSTMLISDESESDQIFARTRVSYQCAAMRIESDDRAYEELIELLHRRHGKMIGLLRQLPDFVLFRLQPHAGQFVMGFGQAYRLCGPDLDQLEHATSA
ncbi:MAG: HugZ family protein [Granulosicoccus sp.]